MFFCCTDGKLEYVSCPHTYSALVSPLWASFPDYSVSNYLLQSPYPGLIHTLRSWLLPPASQVPILTFQQRRLATYPACCRSSIPGDLHCPILLCQLITSSPSFCFQPPLHLPVRAYPSFVPFPDFQAQLLSLTFNQKTRSSASGKTWLDG